MKVDTYTVQFRFPDPYYLLPDVLAGTTHLGGTPGGPLWHGRLCPGTLLETVPSRSM